MVQSSEILAQLESVKLQINQATKEVNIAQEALKKAAEPISSGFAGIFDLIANPDTLENVGVDVTGEQVELEHDHEINI